MQVASQTSSASNQSVQREIYQASLLKKAVQAEGDSALKLLESTEQTSEGDARDSRVGVYLNARA